MRSALTLSCIAALVVVTSACSQSSPPKNDPTSTVQGQLTTSSFAAAPAGVDAIDETGARTHATLVADGAFRLDLLKGHLYSLVVVGGPSGDEPMVFPRTGGRLDRTFRVSSGGGIVSLGSVRHLERAPEGGFVIQAPSTGGGLKTATAGGDGEVGECVDGKVQGTGAPCVDDDEKATCEEGPEASDGDGECEDGKDAKTGQPCSDTDEVGENEQDADPNQPMAVPEKNPPDDLGGCKDDGEDGEAADGEKKD